MFTMGIVPTVGVTPNSEIWARPGVSDENTVQSGGRLAPAVTDVALRMTEFHRTSRSSEMNPLDGVAVTGTETFVPFPPDALSGMLIVEVAAVTFTVPPEGVDGMLPSFRSAWLNVRDVELPP